MDKITRKWLKKRVKIVSREIERTGLMNVEKIADNFKFEKRRLFYSEECEPFYKSNKFCHNGSGEKYCLLCSCLNYNSNLKEGECKAGNPLERGYYYDRSKLGLGEIWDCSDCNYPHTRKETINTLNLVKERVLIGEDLNEVLLKLFKGELIENNK